MNESTLRSAGKRLIKQSRDLDHTTTNCGNLYTVRVPLVMKKHCSVLCFVTKNMCIVFCFVYFTAICKSERFNQIIYALAALLLRAKRGRGEHRTRSVLFTN